MSVEIGSNAPDFNLPDAHRTPVGLSQFLGRKAVLLVFYPFAFSGICTAELAAVRDDLPTFQNDLVQVLAVSTDPAPALQAWAKAEDYTFPLLSDFWPHGAVAQQYDSFHRGGGMALRGTFLIDRSGLVTFAERNGPGVPRDQSSWRRAVEALPVG